MKEKMENEINEIWLPLLQKGKTALKQLLNKEKVDIKNLLGVDFPELTTEIFNKMSNDEYKLSKNSLIFI
jgi:hypothetical protein